MLSFYFNFFWKFQEFLYDVSRNYLASRTSKKSTDVCEFSTAKPSLRRRKRRKPKCPARITRRHYTWRTAITSTSEYTVSVRFVRNGAVLQAQIQSLPSPERVSSHPIPYVWTSWNKLITLLRAVVCLY